MGGRKHFSLEDKRVAIELRKAGISLKRIMEQLQISERSLRSVLAHARKNPSVPVDDSAYLKALVESMPRRLEAVIQNGGNATKY
jgi:orotate phosphoribosyltransferase-like protein